jgi:hypothetical protein
LQCLRRRRIIEAAKVINRGMVGSRGLSPGAVQRFCGIGVFVRAPNDEIRWVAVELGVSICRLGVAPANPGGARWAWWVVIDEDFVSLPELQTAS